jgi:hypothetical protein
MRTITLTFTAGEMKTLNVPGKHFRIMAAQAGTVDIDFYLDNISVGEEAVGVDAGYYANPEHGFNRIDITSSTAQTVKIALSNGRGGYDRAVGTVDVSNLPANQGAFSQGRASLSTTSTTIIVGSATRRYLMIQNNDPVQVLRVKLDGNAAAAAEGFRVQPGGSLELQGYVATANINARFEAATATANNVEYVSG